MRKIMLLLIISVLFISGCAGMGFKKRLTLVPDEVWIASDINSDSDGKNWKSREITGGLKWKIK